MISPSAAAAEGNGRTALLRAWLSTTVLFLSGVYVPVAGAFLMVFTPQPGLSLERREGWPSLVSLVLLTAATAAITGGTRVALLYVLGFALFTWLLATLLRGEWSIEATIAIGTFFLALVAASSAIVLAPSPAEITTGLRGVLEEAWTFLIEVYRRSGMPPDVVEQLARGGDRFVGTVLAVAPGLAVVLLGAAVLANVSVVRWRQRWRGDAPVYGDLARWSTPPAFVWLFIAAGYVSFVPNPVLRAIGWNTVAVLLAIYFCQGLAIMQFAFRRWRVPMWARSLAYIFITLEWLAAVGVVMLGLFDLWVDFRQLTPRPVEDDD